jgi:hypothetical protein
MAVWDIEVTDVFERWWDSLSDSERQDVRAAIDLLEVRGPALRFLTVQPLLHRATTKCGSSEFNIKADPIVFCMHSTRREWR